MNDFLYREHLPAPYCVLSPLLHSASHSWHSRLLRRFSTQQRNKHRNRKKHKNKQHLSDSFPHTPQLHTQVRLLHREVNLLLQGVDKQGNLYGAVLHPKGDVRHELLKQGLARMVDWSLVYVSRSDALAMRQAENEGKRARLRLWREWAPPQIDGDADYAGVVVEASGGVYVCVL